MIAVTVEQRIQLLNELKASILKCYGRKLHCVLVVEEGEGLSIIHPADTNAEMLINDAVECLESGAPKLDMIPKKEKPN